MKTLEQIRKREAWEQSQITVPKYHIKTPNREYYSSGIDWREILQMLSGYGYDVPLSACRDLWHGKRRTWFDGVEIEDLFYTFNG